MTAQLTWVQRLTKYVRLYRRSTAIMVAGFGLLALGPALLHASPRLETLVEKFGEALIVAGAVAIAVDVALKKEFSKALKEDVLDAFVGWELPTEVKDRVWYILRMPFVRRDMVLEYTFERVDSGGDPAYYRVGSTTWYQVQNLTGSELDYPFRSATERSNPPGLPSNQIVSMACEGYPAEMTGTSLDALTGDSGPYRTAEWKVRVPPGKHQTTKCTTEREAFYPIGGDIVLDFLEPPVVGVTVRVFGGCPTDC